MIASWQTGFMFAYGQEGDCFRAPFVFSDEDFGLDRGLFEQFAMDLGQKMGIALSKESDGVQGVRRKYAQDS
jgi:hypothetical protein